MPTLIRRGWVPVHHPTNTVAWQLFRFTRPQLWFMLQTDIGGWRWHRISIGRR